MNLLLFTISVSQNWHVHSKLPPKTLHNWIIFGCHSFERVSFLVFGNWFGKKAQIRFLYERDTGLDNMVIYVNLHGDDDIKAMFLTEIWLFTSFEGRRKICGSVQSIRQTGHLPGTAPTTFKTFLLALTL